MDINDNTVKLIFLREVMSTSKVYLDDLPDKFDLDSALWELTLDDHCVIFIHFLLRAKCDGITLCGVKPFAFCDHAKIY